ncbi:hypothetical protein F511_32915 [Dorcoceras hygrometricum]|uniref:Uncharacterized protein n=1 Tax=Dorcoceras hygrometricum TaxID=472368 RepID=A0A2Z7D148_9LAMI|nr:hypothetical protein F511_32915 [Dorcoceras hygrometricum]
MATRELFLIVALLLHVLYVGTACAESSSLVEEEGSAAFLVRNEAVPQATAVDESFELELNQLQSKISYLESSIEGKTGELKEKDGSIEHLEKVIQEKSNVLLSLQSIVQSFREKASLNVGGQPGEVDGRINDIQKQIFNLKKEVEAQTQKKNDLKVRVNVAKEKIEGMNLKLENLRRINEGQQSKIRDAQCALQVAEEEMLKAKLEASLVGKQLEEVRQAWLPSWLSTHLVHFQLFVTRHWNKNGKPVLDLTIQEALKKKSEVAKWMHPRIKTFETQWIPTIKSRCKTFVNDLQPMVQTLSTQAIDYYHVAHSAIKPHVVTVLEVIDPYVQEAKIFTKPYVDHVSKSARPHVDKVLKFFKPYSKKVARYHKKITRKVHVYHSLIQATLSKTLRSYELTKPLAKPRFVWFTASVLMAMPLVVLSKLILRKEPKRRPRHSHKTSHTHRRSKRSRQDK